MNTGILNHICICPGLSYATCDRKTLKALLLGTDGTICWKGGLWRIASKHLGAGVYEVKLKPYKVRT